MAMVILPETAHDFGIMMKASPDKALTCLSLIVLVAALVHFTTLIDMRQSGERTQGMYEWGYVGETPEIGKFRILPVSGHSIRAAVATQAR